MNIRLISATQAGKFNTVFNRWEGVNLFKEYVLFCLRRRKYQRGRKGLTRILRWKESHRLIVKKQNPKEPEQDTFKEDDGFRLYRGMMYAFLIEIIALIFIYFVWRLFH